jgi:hypothetical protein
MKQTALVICVIILFPLQALANNIQAFVDRTQTAIDEMVHFTVSISDGEGSVDVSPIKDFQVLSEGTSSSVQIINSHVSRKTAYNYTLVPLRQGRLRIPSLTVTVKGKSFQTREIIVTVTKNPQKEEVTRDVFVEASVSKENPYVGQSIRYAFKLYHAVKIANAKLIQEPSFTGFTSKKIDQNKTYRTVIRGRDFEVTEVSYILTPTAAGSHTIEPAVLSLDIVQHRQRGKSNPFDSFFDNSFFNDPFFGRSALAPVTCRTDPLSLNILPLPPDSEQNTFSGLVGRFSLHGELEKNEITAGESTTLSITIEGTGNIMDASAPEIKLPESFKVYQDNPEQDIHINAEGYSGKKVFRYALVAVKNGDFSISPVHFRYFDTASERYITLSSTPFSIKVIPSKEGNKLEIFSTQAQTPRPQKSLKNKVAFTGRDILPIKDTPDVLNHRQSLSLLRFLVYYWIPILLFLGVKLGLVLFKKSDDPTTVMARKAKESLKKINKTAADEIFLSSLYRSLVYAIFSTAGSKGESLTYAEAEKLLNANGIGAETAAEAASLLIQIESAKYSGMDLESSIKMDLFSKTQKIVRRLCR